MTNTNFIGRVGSNGVRDKLSPHYGLKVAGLFYDEEKDKYVLVAPHYNQRSHDIADKSYCASKHDTAESYSKCSCGFYSYKSVPDTVQHWRVECGGNSNHALLEVALSGRVIVAEKGYRAEIQRVTKVVMPRCWACFNAGEYMVRHESNFMVAGCSSCTEGIKRMTFDEFSKAISVPDFAPIEVTSVKDLSKEAHNFVGIQGQIANIKELIDGLAASGNLDALDQIISHGNSTMNKLLS